MANRTNSLSHTKWVCKYHIVFVPKYRRKIIYNQYRADLQEIIRTLCKYKDVEILEGQMSRKGTPIDDSPIESFHNILKKETLYNNYITSLEEYLLLVEDWLNFYNTSRLKNRKR